MRQLSGLEAIQSTSSVRAVSTRHQVVGRPDVHARFLQLFIGYDDEREGAEQVTDESVNASVSPVPSDDEMFATLGLPEHAGHAFCISRAAMRDRFFDDCSRIPMPDYPHAIWRDLITENYLVVRPNADGQYLDEHGCSAFSENGAGAVIDDYEAYRYCFQRAKQSHTQFFESIRALIVSEIALFAQTNPSIDYDTWIDDHCGDQILVKAHEASHCRGALVRITRHDIAGSGSEPSFMEHIRRKLGALTKELYAQPDGNIDRFAFPILT